MHRAIFGLALLLASACSDSTRAREPIEIASFHAARASLHADVTGDGDADLIITENFDGPMRIYSGLDPGGPAVATIDADGIVTPSAGDITGDGLDDLFISQPFNGKLMVFASPVQGELSVDDAFLVFSGSPANFAGASWVGDMDEDGEPDWIVGAPGEPEESCQITPDGVLLFRGPLDGGELTPDDADLRIYDPGSCDGFGVATTTIDGQPRLVVAPFAGPLHVFDINSAITAADVELTRADAAAIIAFDGVSLRAPMTIQGSRFRTAAGITHGNNFFTAAVEFTIDGDAPQLRRTFAIADDELGVHHAFADLDGDGHDDIAVGLHGAPARISFGPWSSDVDLRSASDVDLNVQLRPGEIHTIGAGGASRGLLMVSAESGFHVYRFE